MSNVDEEKFRAFANVRQVERCCGTCRHFERDWDRIEPGPIMGEKFKEFRNLLHEARNRNETLYFG